MKVITGRAGAEVSNFTHGKVAGVEKENSGVEGAHKTEQKAEDVYLSLIHISEPTRPY